MTLLDTCTLLWLTAAPAKLSKTAQKHLSLQRGQLFVSAISAFEIGVKYGRGKLELPMPLQDWYAEALEFHGLREVPVNGSIALYSTTLPRLHADPCDRMIVATAQLLRMKVVTPDSLIRAYPEVEVVW